MLTLYGRSGCSLCENMATIVKPYLSAGGIRLQIVDIDTDPALRARFDWDVPLLFDRKIEICRHALDVTAFEAWLREV